jgi:hypothetical protein
MARVGHTTINMQPPLDFHVYISVTKLARMNSDFHYTKYHAARAYLLLYMLNLEEINAKN